MAIKINGTNTAAAPGITGDDTDTGLVYGTNQIDFSTGGTSRATIDSTGRLLLGTTDVGVSGVDNLIVNVPSGNGGMTIRSGNSNNGNVFFSDGTSGAAEYAGYLQYQHAQDVLVIGTSGSERMSIDSSGHLTVTGVQGASAGLYLIADQGDDNGDGWRINSNQDANDLTLANNTSGSYADKLTLTKEGNISVSGSGLSDKDLKDNIATVTTTALDKIKELVPKTFTWKKYDNNRTFTGFIAQDVESVLPILVNGTDGEKNMSLDYNGVLAYAVKAITELSAEVETLKTKVATLEAG